MAVKKFSSFEIKQASGKLSDSRGVNVTDETIKIEKSVKSVSDAITGFVIAASEEKASKELKESHAGVIREFATTVRNYFTEKGDYTKTFQFFGKIIGGIQHILEVAQPDKFTFSTKKEDIANIKTVLGKDTFDQIFEEEASIAIKKTIMENDKERRKLTKLLVQALGEDGVKEYFERDTVYTIKAGLAEKMHKFDDTIQTVLKDNLKQALDSVKDVSKSVEK